MLYKLAIPLLPIIVILGGCGDNTQVISQTPTIKTIFPQDSSENIDVNTKINILFNKTIDPLSLTNKTIMLKNIDKNISVEGTVEYQNFRAYFTSKYVLKPLTNYSLAISNSISDLDGNHINAKTIKFKTANITRQSLLSTFVTESYSSYDDGYYQEGLPRVISRDTATQTVSDLTTKLMWQDNNRSIDDTVSYLEAINICQDLNLSEYSDWRLPTISELENITDFSHSNL